MSARIDKRLILLLKSDQWAICKEEMSAMIDKLLILLLKIDQWSIFKRRMGGIGSGKYDLERDLESYLEFLVAGPAGRAGSSPYIAMAGKIFQPTHPHTHTPHLIDFINPACQLLGKRSTLVPRSPRAVTHDNNNNNPDEVSHGKQAARKRFHRGRSLKEYTG